jgi:hypothetical protein
MMNISRKILARAAAVAVAATTAVVLLGSWSTINRLDRYRTEDETLTVNMRIPPNATVDIDSSVWIESRNPIGTAIRVGTTMLKASEAAEGEETMHAALSSVDVPASPQMFGMGEIGADILTAAMLATLTVEQLEEGFRLLARESGRTVVRLLEGDLYRARYR